MKLKWHEIIEAQNGLRILIKELLSDKQMDLAQQAAKVSRQLKAEVDLFQGLREDLFGLYATQVDGNWTIAPNSEAMRNYRADLIKLLNQEVKLPVEPLVIPTEIIQRLDSDTFIQISPILRWE